MAQLGFNADDFADREDRPSYDPLPAGEYAVMVTNSSIQDTKSGGQMLVLELTVDGGDFDSRKVWDRLNIVNANTTAQRIAHETLADYCNVCGRAQVEDSEELHGVPFRVELSLEPAKGEYGPSNRVKKVLYEDGSSPRGGERPAPKKAAPPAGGARKPWQR